MVHYGKDIFLLSLNVRITVKRTASSKNEKAVLFYYFHPRRGIKGPLLLSDPCSDLHPPGQQEHLSLPR